MERAAGPAIIDVVTDPDAPRPHPRLSEAERTRVLDELAQEYAWGNLRPARKSAT
jgi:hypothetical protein